MVIPSVTCRIAALSLSGFFVPKAVLYYWKFQSFFFLIPYKSRFAFKRKKKLVNSLALIANTSLPISTAFDRNASNKHVKASISFMPLLSWFFIAVFSPWSCRTPLFPSWGLSRAVLLSGSAGPWAEPAQPCGSNAEPSDGPQQLGDTAVSWGWGSRALPSTHNACQSLGLSEHP